MGVNIPCLTSYYLTNWYGRINPYWKLALVFKCLTDNIMLDDFKSVLQRLGAMKVDGSTAMLPNSMNLLPSEKLGPGDHSEVEDANSSSRLRTERALSLSGRMLDDDEVLDSSGHGRRKQSMAAHAVSNFSLKIQKLPKLPLSQFKSEKDDQRTAEK